ncbi:uncharacterized protein [Rutidosis leptorrhynchoides]|uniref:uncharacterized protein n=1 Tax=Rutidosis leptorrhynchoides TaxID=125765 RepID=UPI003A9989BD
MGDSASVTKINSLYFGNPFVVKSTDDETLAKKWDRCNSVVLSWILGSMTEELYFGQIFSTYASVVCKELQETYDKVDASIVFNLHLKITTIKQNGTSISEYYHTLNSLWKQYDAMVKLPECTCAGANDFKEHNKMSKLMKFLMGLDDVYMSVRSNILSKDPVHDVKSAYGIISREVSHRGVNIKDNKVSAYVAHTPKGNSANNTKFSSNNRSGNNWNRGPNLSLKCSRCNKLGHTIDRCFELIGYPPGYRRPFNQN